MTQQALLQEIFMPAAPLMKDLPFLADAVQAVCMSGCSGDCKSRLSMTPGLTDVPANFYA